jgi:ABC-type branched-subunit amino acid transport system ATPase component
LATFVEVSVLSSLRIEGFRAFQKLEIGRLGRVNLLVGRNNTGKSTVLEALHLLAAGNDQALFRKRIEGLLLQREEYGSQSREIDPLRLLHRSYAFQKPVHIHSSSRRQVFFAYPGSSIEARVTRGSGASTLELGGGVVRQIEPEQLQPPLPCTLVRARGMDADELSSAFDDIGLTDSEETVLEALRLITPDLDRVMFIQVNGGAPKRIPFARRQGGEREPLRSMGEGTIRALELSLAAARSAGGLLLIDEFENGVHFSVLPELWTLIFRMAAHLDVQVFATTHSWDCVEAFQQAAAAHAEEGVLIRLARQGDTIEAVCLDERDLAVVSREHIEVR